MDDVQVEGIESANAAVRLEKQVGVALTSIGASSAMFWLAQALRCWKTENKE